ncbi:MAG: pyridoxal-phosphate dependent enzyme [Pseudomonadota bacterium]
MTLTVSPSGIKAAERVIDQAVRGTPLLSDIRLPQVSAISVVLKDETRTPIGSFKGRGTEYFAHQYADKTPKVVCASAGNFGQGLARSMTRRGGEAIVFAATNANPLKIDRMRELGADVRLAGADFDAANAAAKAFAAEQDLPFVEDAAFGEIAEGAGTIAKEMTDAGAAFEAIYVPVGGGALINGIGTWLKQCRPEVKVIGVCAEGAPAFAHSWREGRVIETKTVDTFADGIAIRTPLWPAIQLMRRVVDDCILVSDQQMLDAMQTMHKALGLRLEPAGAAGIAGALCDAPARGVEQAATVLCGANVPPDKQLAWFGSDPG